MYKLYMYQESTLTEADVGSDVFCKNALLYPVSFLEKQDLAYILVYFFLLSTH